MPSARNASTRDAADAGYMLVACIVMVFLVLLALSVAAPRVARGLERDKEVEAKHRAEQYVRAIRVFYRKNGHYPTSIEQLKLTNSQRYLRQDYIDPLTGTSDWRLIHVGENQTKVKGFFGQDLPGIAGTGIGSAIGTPAATTPGTPFGGNPVGGNNPSSPPIGGATGSTAGAGSGAGSGTASSPDPTQANGGGGPIMGVGVPKTGEAMIVVNEQTQFEQWEFLYDPRIEALYAKGALNGGINSSAGGAGTGPTGGLPTPPPGFGSSTTPPTQPTTPPATPQ